MEWETIGVYYLGATLSVIVYFVVAWSTGLVLDENRNLIRKYFVVHIVVFKWL